MNEHVPKLLGAYLDGELDEQNREKIRAHLAECQPCCQELDSLKNLSGLLHSTSIPGISSRVFNSRLTRQLPQRAIPRQISTSGSLIWWLIPVIVLMIALIIQISTGLTIFVLAADQAGLLGRLSSLLAGFSRVTSQPETIITFVNQLMAGDLAVIGTGLNTISTFGDNLVGLLLQAALAFIYIAWMVVAWNNRHRLLAGSLGAHAFSHVGISK